MMSLASDLNRRYKSECGMPRAGLVVGAPRTSNQRFDVITTEKLTPDSPNVWRAIETKLLFLMWLIVPVMMVIRLDTTGGALADPLLWVLLMAFCFATVEARSLTARGHGSWAGHAFIAAGYASLMFSAWATNPAIAALWPFLTFHVFIRMQPRLAALVSSGLLLAMVATMFLKQSVPALQMGRALTVGLAITALFYLFFSFLRKTLDNLSHTQQLLNNSITSLVYGVMLVDVSGRIKVANRRVAELLDLPDGVLRTDMHERELLDFMRERGDLTVASVDTMQLYDRHWRSLSSAALGTEDKLDLLTRLGQGDVFGYYIRRTLRGRFLKVTVAPAADGGHIRTYEDVTDSQLLNQQLLAVVKDLQQMRKKDQDRSREQIIQALSKLAKYRDEETGEHILRTQLYIRALADGLRGMGHYADVLTDDFVETTVKAAPMHDLGKIGIPDAILKKPGRLSDSEMQVMRTHALIGEATLNALCNADEDANSLLSSAARIAGGHHENWDGSGYPRQIKEHQIPLEARLMTLADIYDALTTARVYKKAWTHEEAAAEIRKLSGAKLDPALVDAFVRQEDQFRAIAIRFKDDDTREAS